MGDKRPRGFSAVSNRNKAALLMVAAALFGALLSITVKWIQDVPVFEKMFFRCFIGIIVVTFTIVKEKHKLIGNRQLPIIGRGITGFCSTALYYMALTYAPVAETVTLTNTYPFLLAIFCWIFLGEKLRGFHIVALLLSFIGAVMIIRPGFTEVNKFYIIALVSAVFMAMTYTFLRKARQTDHPSVIVFWYSVICSIGCIPFMVFGDFVLPTPFQLFQLLCLGFVATVYQLLMSSAYKFAPATEVSIYSYTMIIFSAVFGIIIWAEIPPIFTVLGALLIVSGAFVIYRGNNSRKNKASDEKDAPSDEADNL